MAHKYIAPEPPFSLCVQCGKPEDYDRDVEPFEIHGFKLDDGEGLHWPEPPEGWLYIQEAPQGKEVQVMLNGGKVLIAHWASDLSGEEQPPFEGWFKADISDVTGDVIGYRDIGKPQGWRPLQPKGDSQ